MSSRNLYSNVVRSGRSDEDLGLVLGEQDSFRVYNMIRTHSLTL